MNDSKKIGSEPQLLPSNAGKTPESRHRMPSNAGKGRPKGVPNRITADLRTMILAALDKAGGIDYLVGQANSNPVAFLALISKLVPAKVATDTTISVSKSSPVRDDISAAIRMRLSTKSHP